MKQFSKKERVLFIGNAQIGEWPTTNKKSNFTEVFDRAFPSETYDTWHKTSWGCDDFNYHSGIFVQPPKNCFFEWIQRFCPKRVWS